VAVLQRDRKVLKDKYRFLLKKPPIPPNHYVKPYLRDNGRMGEYILEVEQKFNICTNFLLCKFKGCPHIKKHSTNYYYDGKKWSTCREISCGQRYAIQPDVGTGEKEGEHSCIEVKE